MISHIFLGWASAGGGKNKAPASPTVGARSAGPFRALASEDGGEDDHRESCREFSSQTLRSQADWSQNIVKPRNWFDPEPSI